MRVQQVHTADMAVIACVAGITDVRDAMELAYICSRADTGLLLIHGGALPSQFFELRTGFAGEFVQRLVNCRLRTAAVFDPGVSYSGRFVEFLLEARGHPQFRAFDVSKDAMAWLSASAVRSA